MTKHPTEHEDLHVHFPGDSLYLFKISKEFTDVIKFYLQSSVVMASKFEPVSKGAPPEQEYDSKQIISDFSESWEHEYDNFVGAFGEMFSQVQRQCSSMSSKGETCCEDMKQMFSERIADAISSLLHGNFSSVESRIIFRIDVVKLECNDLVKEPMPKKLLEKLSKNKTIRDNIYLVLLDYHYFGTNIGSHKDIREMDSFMRLVACNYNLEKNLVSSDSEFYGRGNSGPVLSH